MLTYVVFEFDYMANDYRIHYCGIDYTKSLEVYDTLVSREYTDTIIRKESWKDGELLSAVFYELKENYGTQ